jgi:hypothetical protein
MPVWDFVPTAVFPHSDATMRAINHDRRQIMIELTGSCAGCDQWTTLDDVGLCDVCAAKFDRDLIRQRAWAYSATAFGCDPKDYEALRQMVITAVCRQRRGSQCDWRTKRKLGPVMRSVNGRETSHLVGLSSCRKLGGRLVAGRHKISGMCHNAPLFSTCNWDAHLFIYDLLTVFKSCTIGRMVFKYSPSQQGILVSHCCLVPK